MVDVVCPRVTVFTNNVRPFISIMRIKDCLLEDGCVAMIMSDPGLGLINNSGELELPGPPTAVTTLKIKPGLVIVPPGVVTLTSPLAPAPTTAVMVVAFTVINEAAATPPKLTAVAPVKLVPLIVTIVPVGPFGGVKDVIAGGDT